MDFNLYKVETAPSTVYYIPNFITSDEETHIIKNVNSVPKPKWTFLSNRKLQDYGGVPHKNGMITETIPNWLKLYMDKISALTVFEDKKPNHCLVNEYQSGQGIMPHTDGPLFYPTVTTISCGSHTILEFLENTASREKICDLLLERRSLVILKDDMYSKYLHSIKEIKKDEITKTCANLDYCGQKHNVGDVCYRDTRISLTIRNVPKVCKVKLWNLK